MQYSTWSDPQIGWCIMRYQIFQRGDNPVTSQPVATFTTERAATLDCKHLTFDAFVVDQKRVASGESKLYQNWQKEIYIPLS